MTQTLNKSLHSSSSFFIDGWGMTIFVFSFGCETLAFSRLCALFDAVLARFRFTAWEAFDCCFSRSLFFFPLCFSDTSEIFVFCTFCALSSVWFMMVRFLPLFYCRYENRIDRGESWNIPQSSNVPQILRIFGRFASQISHNKFSDKLAYLKIYFWLAFFAFL